MREYIEKLQQEGQVDVVETEVDPVHELAAVTQRFQKESQFYDAPYKLGDRLLRLRKY